LTRHTNVRLTARLAGVFFLLTILTGVLAEMVVNDRLVVSGDAAATATNILGQKGLFQFGFALYMVEMACNVVVTVLFYDLLKPVSRSLALVAAFLGVTGCVIKTMSRLFFIAPLLVLGGAHYLNAFSPEQLQALALLFLKINDQGAGMALIYLGFNTLLNGYLIVRSTFLPRILGVLGIISGVGWLSFLYAPLASRLWTYIVLVGLLGSAAKILWLLVFGVNEQRWREQA
jgi:hypothetical protein